MTETVIETLVVRHEIDVLLVTAREGVTALEKASSMIHIPTREMAKIRTAVKKMREAAVYIEDRAHNTPVKSTATTKSALKDALKDASQEQIDRAYAILSGQDAPDEKPEDELAEGGAMVEEAYYEVDSTDEDEEEVFLPPVEWDEG